MPSAKKIPDPSIRPKRPPARTKQARERQMMALAEELAEQQLRDGTASAQVLTHYLKLNSYREELELEKLKRENDLLRAKQEQLVSQVNSEEKYDLVLKAMIRYRGDDEEHYDV